MYEWNAKEKIKTLALKLIPSVDRRIAPTGNGSIWDWGQLRSLKPLFHPNEKHIFIVNFQLETLHCTRQILPFCRAPFWWPIASGDELLIYSRHHSFNKTKQSSFKFASVLICTLLAQYVMQESWMSFSLRKLITFWQLRIQWVSFSMRLNYYLLVIESWTWDQKLQRI